jgi:signal transduction histidine kinase
VFFWPWRYIEVDSACEVTPRTDECEADASVAPIAELCVRALLDNRFMLTLDETLTVHYVSNNTLEWLDIDEDTLGNVSFTSFIHPSHRPLFTPSAAMPLQKRVQIRHRDGNYAWYALKYHVQQNSGWLVILEPINTLVAAEKKLRKAQMEVEHSTRERGEFLRHMSHELRTPLNAILGFAEMMEQGVFGKISNDAYTEYLGLIRESGEDLLAKIVDLMDLSAIGSHNVAMDEQGISASEMIATVVDRLQKVAIGRGITLSMRLNTPIIMLQGDPRLLRKSLCHVLQNAIEYNDIGGSVEIRSALDATGRFHMIVEDNGHGIQPSQLRALSTALNDNANLYSNVEAYRPIGLGLTLTKEYMHLHDGDVTIESHANIGTKVTLTLPSERISVVSYNDKSYLKVAK